MEFEKLCAMIAETLGCDVDQITESTQLVEDLGADSLSLVELAMAIEESTGVTVEDSALPTLKTVGDIAAYIQANS
ncbi:MAG: acyl carrier protein [Oscillospiraceae bacterium]|nr:acyl carrier protein [Oscillospiraceae bacterium]